MKENVKREDGIFAYLFPAPREISVLTITTTKPFLVYILPTKESAKEQMLNLQFIISTYICVTGIILFDHIILWSGSLHVQVAKACTLSATLYQPQCKVLLGFHIYFIVFSHAVISFQHTSPVEYPQARYSLLFVQFSSIKRAYLAEYIS